MKRNMDLIRELLLRLENMPTRQGGICSIPYDDELFTSTGYTGAEVEYHLRQLFMSGYIEYPDSSPMGMSGFGFRALTPQAHDFLDAVRDPIIWRKTKAGALAAGGWTLDLLKDLATGFIKKQIKKLTDIDA